MRKLISLKLYRISHETVEWYESTVTVKGNSFAFGQI